MPTLIINFANSCNTFKVSEKDCVADIKSFYRALAMKYHPLLNPPGSSAKSQVKTIDVACETLPTKLDSSKVCGSEVVTKQRKQPLTAKEKQEKQAQVYGIFIDALLGNSWAE